jgi:hypothetical protein
MHRFRHVFGRGFGLPLRPESHKTSDKQFFIENVIYPRNFPIEVPVSVDLDLKLRFQCSPDF